MANLFRWLKGIESGRNGWVDVYVEAFHQPISDPDRFFRALEIYGQEHLFQALVITSARGLTEDPLPYLLAVCHAEAQKEVELEQAAREYQLRVDTAKHATELANETLIKQINKAKEIAGEQSTSK